MSRKWPSFLLSGARDLILVDGNKTRVLHTGYGIYYGISWDKDNIYVAHRTGLHDIGPDVSMMDRNYKVTRSVPGDFSDVHQILYANDKLYATVTSYNSIGVFDGNQTVLANWTGVKEDKNHINSIWFDGKYFWVGYHNFVAKHGTSEYSRVVKVNQDLTTVLDAFDLGRDIHSVFVDGDLLYVGDSANGRLTVLNMKTKKESFVDIGMWTRGIAVTDEYILVGASIFAPRRSRLLGHGQVSLLDRETLDIVDTRVFDDVGAVMEIRVVDQVDYAHNEIPFPGRL